MTLLNLDASDLHGPEDHAAETARCVCKRKLTDPVSVAFGIGPDCRAKLGITPRKPVRISGAPTGWDIEGQGNLFEHEGTTP